MVAHGYMCKYIYLYTHMYIVHMCVCMCARALFNKDGHETQDAVAPAGQGPQLCSAEHAHGQTGMSTMTAEGRAASVQRLWQLRGGAPRRSRGGRAARLPGSLNPKP